MKNYIPRKRLLPIFIPTVLLVATLQTSLAQGFANLNFEAANLGASPGLYVTTSAALPGWTALFFTSSNTNITTYVLYDATPLGSGAISICDSNTAPGFVPLQGKYSVCLFGGPLSNPTLYSAAISQTALVPVGTQSVFVDVGQSGLAYFAVSVNGQAVNMLPVQIFANYTLFGGDVSAFAGQVSTLTISEAPPPSDPPSAVIIDNIQFSSSPVPEPSAFALVGMAGLLLAWRYWNIEAV